MPVLGLGVGNGTLCSSVGGALGENRAPPAELNTEAHSDRGYKHPVFY